MAEMGQVIVRLRLTNYADLVLHRHGARKGRPRSVLVEALVDTGATELHLQRRIVARLGLEVSGSCPALTANGWSRARIYSPVRLDLMGRFGNFDVFEHPDDVPNLLGRIPLESLDLLVDPKRRVLIGNPAHGGEWATEILTEQSVIDETALV